MASSRITVHLEAADQPCVMVLSLPHRPAALRLQRAHQGPTLIGTAEMFRRLHDALGAYLAAEDAEAEAEAA